MLSQILETLKRPGLLGLVGNRIERRCRQELHSYFESLGRRIAGLNLEDLVEQSTPALVRHTVQLRTAHVIRVFTPVLKSVLEHNIVAALKAADKIHHYAEADNPNDVNPDDLGIDITSDDFAPAMTSEEAALYASVRAGELVTGINQTTQQRIADAIETGITDELGVPGTGRLLRAVLGDMTRLRSEMIASTEMNDAFSEATMRKLDRLGVAYKQWITAGACCDECADNEAASPIPIDEDFPSGDARPPAHPNCRCAVTGAREPAA